VTGCLYVECMNEVKHVCRTGVTQLMSCVRPIYAQDEIRARDLSMTYNLRRCVHEFVGCVHVRCGKRV